MTYDIVCSACGVLPNGTDLTLVDADQRRAFHAAQCKHLVTIITHKV